MIEEFWSACLAESLTTEWVFECIARLADGAGPAAMRMFSIVIANI